MKHSATLVTVSGVAWLGLSAWALFADSRVGEIVALLAGMALLVSTWWLQRSHATPLALLLVDIDHFKLYNDHLGHPQGDRALRAVAAALGQQARRPGELVARYGGEEFALLLPHADATTAATLAERCQAAMAALALPHGASPTAPHVSLSIGVAVLCSATREEPDALLQRVDRALYAAKAAGRARSVVAPEPANGSTP